MQPKSRGSLDSDDLDGTPNKRLRIDDGVAGTSAGNQSSNTLMSEIKQKDECLSQPGVGDVEKPTSGSSGKDVSSVCKEINSPSNSPSLKPVIVKKFEEIPDRVLMTFPERLFAILEAGEETDSLRWLPGGDSFCVTPKSFSTKILDRYFQGTKFESFTRKLNRWGFKRLLGVEIPGKAVAYEHPCFKKGGSGLVKEMTCTTKKTAEAPDAIHLALLRKKESIHTMGLLPQVVSTIGSTGQARQGSPTESCLQPKNQAKGSASAATTSAIGRDSLSHLLRSTAQARMGQQIQSLMAVHDRNIHIKTQQLLGQLAREELTRQRSAASAQLRCQLLLESLQQRHPYSTLSDLKAEVGCGSQAILPPTPAAGSSLENSQQLRLMQYLLRQPSQGIL